jgi:general stress protein YciG
MIKFYVYELICKSTGKWYVGCQTGKDANPGKLGKSYFTSSSTVAKLFKENPENFEIKILFESFEKGSVYEMETLILKERNARDNLMSWNLHNNDYLQNPVKIGILGGASTYKKKTGLFKRTKEQMSETGRKAGLYTFENKIGVHGRTKEQIIKDASKAGRVNFIKKTGIFKRTKEQMSADGRKGGNSCVASGQFLRFAKAGGIAANKLRYRCLDCHFISTAAGLGTHHKHSGHILKEGI